MSEFGFQHSPFVKVHRSTELNVAAGATSLVSFDTALANENGLWDFTNHGYRCGKAGRYLISYSFMFLSVGGGFGSAELGGLRFFPAISYPPNTFSPFSGADVRLLNVGDFLQLNVISFGGAGFKFGENTVGIPYTSVLSFAYLP